MEFMDPMVMLERMKAQAETAKKIQDIEKRIKELVEEAKQASKSAKHFRMIGNREDAELCSKVIEDCFKEATKLQTEAEELAQYYRENLM